MTAAAPANRFRNIVPVLAAVLLAAGVLTGAYIAWTERPSVAEPPADKTTAVFYTNPGATTPQLPLWAAVADRTRNGIPQLTVRLWKNTPELQSVLLAGRGDLWLGHTEGFARAYVRGAPVRLLAVTGWRKMAVVSVDPTVASLDDLPGTLAYAPVGSPAAAMLQAILGSDTPKLQPHEPKQLSLLFLRGKLRTALVPEPLTSVLLEKVPGLHVVAHLEDIYGSRTGHPSRIPWAGLAVHADWAERHPEAVRTLLGAVVAAADRLETAPREAIVSVWPERFHPYVAPETVVRSLERDRIEAVPAGEAADEVRAYLDVVAPEIKTGNRPLDKEFFAP